MPLGHTHNAMGLGRPAAIFDIQLIIERIERSLQMKKGGRWKRVGRMDNFIRLPQTTAFHYAQSSIFHFIWLNLPPEWSWEVLHVGGATFEPYQTWSFERSEKLLFDEGE